MQSPLQVLPAYWLRHLRRALVCTLVLFGVSPASRADTITVDLYFDRLIPFTGILYVPTKSPEPVSTSVDQVGKRFTERISIGSPDGEFTFMNSDSFEHNVFVDEPASNAIFDVGLMQPGEVASMRAEWTPDTLVRMGCKIHPRMRAYLANVRADSFTVFERARNTREYQLTLDDVPADVDHIKLLLAGFDPMEIRLAPGEKQDLVMTRKGRPAATGSASRR